MDPQVTGEAAPTQLKAAGPGLGKLAVEIGLRLVLGGIFIVSGVLKLADPGAFQTDIANFQLIPWSLSGLVALYLPWLEILCGGALLVKRQFFGSGLLLGLLMIAFIAFIASAWARGLDVSCGCFGSSEETGNYHLAIGRNLLILGGLAILLRLGRRNGGES